MTDEADFSGVRGKNRRAALARTSAAVAAASAYPPRSLDLGSQPVPVAAPFKRRMHHWKEHFDRNAEHVWSRSVIVEGLRLEPGSPVDSSKMRWTKLRRLWECGWIQRAESLLGCQANG